MKLAEWVNEFHTRLEATIDHRERKSLIRILREDIPELRDISMTEELEALPKSILNSALDDLERGRPIQYITGSALFFGRYFTVNQDVLIPRQETEEMVYMILENHPDNTYLKVFDACTGSGCIAVTLALERSNWHVLGIDLSEAALHVAKQNAAALRAPVLWEEMDILSRDPESIAPFDILVSNPPYVPESDLHMMDRSVIENEPGLALFVPDDDPLIFYRKLIEICSLRLNAGGSAWFEIHADHGDSIMSIMDQGMYEKVEVHKDMQGKDRFLHLKNKIN